MSNKVLPLIYGISLLILVPISAYLLYANRSLSQDTQKKLEKVDSIDQRLEKLESQPKNTTNTTRESTQTETSPGAKLAELKSTGKVVVLNGSGVVGAASKLKVRLETNGFKVTKIDNTTTQTGSEIQVRPGFEILAKAAQTDVKDITNFPNIKTLPEAEGDVVLIIGR